MKQTRLEWLADRRETLSYEIRQHESEAHYHQRMAKQKSEQLDELSDEFYQLVEMENAPIPVSALSTFSVNQLSTAILADFARSGK